MRAATVLQVLQDLFQVLLHVLFYLWSLLTTNRKTTRRRLSVCDCELGCNQKPGYLSIAAFIPTDTSQRISARSRLVFRRAQYIGARWFDYVRSTTATPSPHPRHSQQQQQQARTSISDVVVTAAEIHKVRQNSTITLIPPFGGDYKHENTRCTCHDESNFSHLVAMLFSR